MERHGLTFIVAVNDENILQRNLFSSPLFASKGKYQIIERHGCNSATIAYNEAIKKAENDIIVFTHQDMYFPESWIYELERALNYLEDIDPCWGVLGCYGRKKGINHGIGRVYTAGIGLNGSVIHKPEAIDTLDEIVIIIRKSSGLSFDSSLPHFHLYGTDICMLARDRGLSNYSIPAYCIHNADLYINLPKEFYECYYHVKKKWKKFLPIHASCIKITRFDSEVKLRKLKIMIKKILGKSVSGKIKTSVKNPRTLIDK